MNTLFSHHIFVRLIDETISYLMAGCACILELLAEPLYILSQNLLLLKLRLMVETAATLSRCLTMYILIVYQTGMVRLKLEYAVNLEIYRL